MKRMLCATAVGVAAAGVAACATQAVAQGASAPQNPQIEIVYAQPRDAGLRPIHDRLKARGVLEELSQFLVPLRLPRKLTVRTDQCGAVTRPYQPQGPVTIYELVDQIEKTAAKVDAAARPTAIAGAFIVVVLHEFAHGLFDVLQVPVWGREGDAADRLAALVMLQFGEDLAFRTIVGATAFFTASNKTWTGSAFADVNSPEQQRYYNYLCIAYGGAPIPFKGLVTPDQKGQQTLPPARARRCESEYEQVMKAFNQWVRPSVDPVLLVKVRATPWLRPSDVK
jgi:Putative metallopeptidase